jgi:GT2 family glycosyltransferase
LLDALVDARNTLALEELAIEILVGDTGSRDERVVEKYEALAAKITVERNLKYHFSRCNNLMFQRHVRYANTLFLNNDIIFDNAVDSLRRMMWHMARRQDTGVMGSYLFYPDGQVQHAGIDFFREGPLRGLCYHPYHRKSLPREIPIGSATPVPAVTGACLLIRSERFASLGGFDPAYESECQDVALCLSARRVGDGCELVNVGRIVHIENATRRSDTENWRDRSRFIRQWSGFVEAMG